MIHWCAEIGSNFNGSKDRLFKLIDKAKGIGCDSIKLQLFKACFLWHSSYTKQLKIAKKRELPAIWIPEIAKYCENININLGISPFDSAAVSIIKDYVDFIKISSFDILRKDLVSECASLPIPLIVSIGEANQKELDNLLITIKTTKEAEVLKSITYMCFLYCVSDYPARKKDIDMFKLEAIKYTVSKYFDPALVGYSDHSKDPDVIYEAYKRGAGWIEFHLDLEDEEGWEGTGHCWRPNDIQVVMNEVKGNEKYAQYKRTLRADPSDGLRPCLELRRDDK